MARNNLGRLFTSVSPKLPSPFPISESSICSNSVSRLISSSTQQPQQHHQEKTPNKEQEETLKANSENHNEEDQEDGEEDDDLVNKQTGEVGGPRGPEPTRYGDWERNGRCYDF
ncbi:hypothetical protein Patl1_20348 [Pistacia atlantica]|uniref:Uncharacterized protein n=1 Tax=Pistacia atlantica TaxID=434234 RepID=A0ACC1BN51_9ROSI|nr:hypothetical protein Patl1_20348 [Pistacia atlantica]